MAATESASRIRQPSRLQRRAPASLQIHRSTEWNVAIPLLSPVTSPQAPIFIQTTPPEINSRNDGGHHHQAASGAGSEQKPAAVFKKWQAAPFCFEPAPMASFVVVDGSRR